MSSSGIGSVPPPLAKIQFTTQDGHLTTIAFSFLQQLWAALFGAGGLVPSIVVISLPVAGSVTAYNAVTINGVGQAAEPDITVISDGLGLFGIATSTGSVGSSINVQTFGTVTNTAWTWTPGEPVWCGAGGVLVQTAPSTAGDWVRRVGLAIEATVISVSLGELVELT